MVEETAMLIGTTVSRKEGNIYIPEPVTYG